MSDTTNKYESQETPEGLYRHKKGSLPRLTSKNYATWSRNVRAILRSVRVWSIVNGKEHAPIAPPGVTEATAPEANGNAIQIHEEKLEMFEARSEKAAQILYNSTSQNLRPYIDGVDDPAEIWTTLFQRASTKHRSE